MKKDMCQKCKKYTFVEKHHILPKSIFGEGETIYLCPTCHSEFHYEVLGVENAKNTDMVFHIYTFRKWLCGLSIFAILFGISLYFDFFKIKNFFNF